MNDERHGYGHVREIPNRRRPSDQLDGHRQRLIVTLDSKWVNGTTLTYHVMTNSSPRQDQLIQQAFQEWKDTGMGLEFQSVSDPTQAMIRIGFQAGDGSWSYVGRDVLNITNPTDRTMNIGWDNAQTYDTWLHEIGHALGFPHEHQNPTGGIVWDDEAVYASLGGPPNHWTRERTFHNILRKLNPDDIQASTWDKDSIMHYPFPARLIRQPAQYQTEPLDPANGWSALDKTKALHFYPPIDTVKTHTLTLSNQPLTLGNLKDGEQERFTIRFPSQTNVDLFTSGQADTYMVLFRQQQQDASSKQLQQLVTDDDSGQERNARVSYQLEPNVSYILQLRLYWQARNTSTSNNTSRTGPQLHMIVSSSGGGGGDGGGGSKCCAIL